jgi:hypothetical protein
MDDGCDDGDTTVGTEDGHVLEDDEEDAAQLQLLLASAAEEVRTGEYGSGPLPILDSSEGAAGGAGAGAAPGAAAPASEGTTLASSHRVPDVRGGALQPPAPAHGGVLALEGTSPALKRFLARLAFANARSRVMNTRAYDAFVKARESGFTGKMALRRKFAALIPEPALTHTVLEVVSYLTFDRVGEITEAAVRIECDGELANVTEPLSVPAYAAAIIAMPSLPAELGVLVADANAHAAHATQGQELELARALERRLREADELAAMGSERGASVAAPSSRRSAAGAGPSLTELFLSSGLQAAAHAARAAPAPSVSPAVAAAAMIAGGGSAAAGSAPTPAGAAAATVAHASASPAAAAAPPLRLQSMRR